MKRGIRLSSMNRNKLISFFAFIITGVFPIIFLYAQNIQEAYFKDMIEPIGVFILIGIVAAFLFYLFTRGFEVSFFSASIFIICFANYSSIEKLIRSVLPDLRYWHIVPILIVVLFHIAFIMKSQKKLNLINNLNKLLLISFGGLIAFNIVMALPTIVKKIQINKTETLVASLEKPVIENSDIKKRNIYYIILDEYASFNSIKKYYDYDPSEFVTKLENLGFNISYTTRNDSHQTYTVTGNLLNLDYVVVNEMLHDEKFKFRENPYLFRLLDQYDYKIYNYSDVIKWNGEWGGDLKQVSSSESNAFSYMVYSNSALYPFVSEKNNVGGAGVSALEYEHIKMVTAQLNALEKMGQTKEFPVFNYVHMVCPHQPFIFDRQGNLPPVSESENWDNPQYYLDQYIYISNRISNIVENIVKNDPEAIIILQSDHGARQAKDKEGNKISFEEMTNVLNCVYYGGETLEIEGQSGVNTLRIIFNKLFNMDMPILEVPGVDN